MSEIRRLNDARRERFCHPGAEGDEFFICDLGTPWCPVDHDEALEAVMLEAVAEGLSKQLDALRSELIQRGCFVSSIERRSERWVVFYRDRWGQKSATHFSADYIDPAVALHAHRAQLERERRAIDEKASQAAKHRVVIFGVVVWSCVAIMLITMLVTALTR